MTFLIFKLDVFIIEFRRNGALDDVDVSEDFGYGIILLFTKRARKESYSDDKTTSAFYQKDAEISEHARPDTRTFSFRDCFYLIYFSRFFFFLYLDCAPITHEHVQSDLCGGTQRASRSRVGFSIGSMPNVLPSSRRVHLPRYLPAGVCYVVCSGRREVVNCAITTCVCVRRTCRAPRSEHLISVSTPEGDGDALKCACNTPRERE